MDPTENGGHVNWAAICNTTLDDGYNNVAEALVKDPAHFRTFSALVAEWVSKDDITANCSLTYTKSASEYDTKHALCAFAKETPEQGDVQSRAIIVAFVARFCTDFRILLLREIQEYTCAKNFDIRLFGEFGRGKSGKRSVVVRTAAHPTEIACDIMKMIDKS